MTTDYCSKCDCGEQRVIVNKRHYLCQEKNKERLEAQKSKKEKSKIDKKHKNLYTCSDGSRVTQAQIDKNYKEAIENIKWQRGLDVCESCGSNKYPLSNSHIISRQRCKELGLADLIWDENNIVVECFEERCSHPNRCHNIWEDGGIEQKKNLKTFDKKVDYILKYDPEQYSKIEEEL